MCELSSMMGPGDEFNIHEANNTSFYLPRSGKVMQKCRSKKGLMDFETLKPLFLVLFGIILSSFEPV